MQIGRIEEITPDEWQEMVEVDTGRLRIIALDRDNLKLCRESRNLMEKSLGLNITQAVLEPLVEKELYEALEMMIELVEEDEENYLWNTNWEIVLKEENRIIGGFCFQGPPTLRQEVQIGYVLQPQYRGKGFITEALQKMTEWAFCQPGVAAVIAETEKENGASCRVLEKIGMKRFREGEKTYWWRMEKYCREVLDVFQNGFSIDLGARDPDNCDQFRYGRSDP